jgi:hypothetical protein
VVVFGPLRGILAAGVRASGKLTSVAHNSCAHRCFASGSIKVRGVHGATCVRQKSLRIATDRRQGETRTDLTAEKTCKYLHAFGVRAPRSWEVKQFTIRPGIHVHASGTPILDCSTTAGHCAQIASGSHQSGAALANCFL